MKSRIGRKDHLAHAGNTQYVDNSDNLNNLNKSQLFKALWKIREGLKKMRLSENEKSELLFLIKSICSLEKKKEDDLGDAELAAELRKLWRESYSEQLKNAIELLEDIASETREFALKELEEYLLNALGHEFAESKAVRSIIHKKVAGIYTKAKSKWAEDKPKVVDNTIIDKRAIAFIENNGVYWLGEHYSSAIAEKVAETGKTVLEMGLGTKDFTEMLESQLSTVLDITDYKYWDITAESLLVRSKAFGNVFGMEEVGVKEYTIFAMGDEKTCPVCQELDGRSFSVTAAADVCRNVLELTDLEDVKNALPWTSTPPIGVSSAKLISQGRMLPPIHGHCRCDVVISEKTTKRQVTKQILKTLKGTKQNPAKVISLDMDTRIALVSAHGASRQGVPGWKYDLISSKDNGKIKARNVYDGIGRLTTAFHFESHAGSGPHSTNPHVHRTIYHSNEPNEVGERSDVPQALWSWEKEVIAAMPQDIIKGGGVLWQIKKAITQIKQILKMI